MTITRFGLIRDGAQLGQFEKAVVARDDAEIVARCDTNADTAKQLISRTDLDAIILDCAPVKVPGLIIQALENDLHILSLQMPSCGVEDIINIRRAEASAPGKIVKFGVGHRYQGSIVEAKKLADSKALGKLLSMRGLYGQAGGHPDQQDWRDNFGQAGGGVLIDLGLKMLDLMQMFAGPIEEVKSLVDDRAQTARGVEDNVMALLRTHAGVMAMLHASQTQWRQTFRLELGFQDGSIWLDGLISEPDAFSPEMLIISRLKRDPAGQAIANPAEDIREFTASQAAAHEVQEFIHAVRGDARLENGSSQQAFDAINVAQRIYAADPTFELEAL